ncbi:MAG TPA: glycosyltransferase [Campylobacterales bacterium]|nr:glycosyltransferase [Campylobacterales bacterium]
MEKTIIIVEDSSKVTFGGGQRGTIDIIESLIDHFDIVLFDCSNSSIFQKKISKYQIEKRYLKCYGKLVGGDKSSFSVGKLELLLFPILTLWNIYILRKFAKKNTIFYTSNKKHLLLLYILKKMFGIEYIFHSRTFIDRDSIYSKLMKPPLQNAKSVIAVSDFIRSNLEFVQPKLIYDALNFDERFFNYHIPKQIGKTIIIATVSELLKLKGIEYFIQSYQYLPKSILEQYTIKYYIYGEGKERDYLMRLSKDNPNIEFRGFQENIYQEYIETIDIVVVPSIVPEAFGRTSIEGAFFGVVPIVSNIGAQKELISQIDTNLLFENKNPKDIALKIEYAIRNYELLSKLSMEFSNQFLFDKFRKEILEVFESV